MNRVILTAAILAMAITASSCLHRPEPEICFCNKTGGDLLDVSVSYGTNQLTTDLVAEGKTASWACRLLPVPQTVVFKWTTETGDRTTNVMEFISNRRRSDCRKDLHSFESYVVSTNPTWCTKHKANCPPIWFETREAAESHLDKCDKIFFSQTENGHMMPIFYSEQL